MATKNKQPEPEERPGTRQRGNTNPLKPRREPEFNEHPYGTRRGGKDSLHPEVRYNDDFED